MDVCGKAPNPITALRERLGCSRAELARQSGCSYGSLSWVEGGYCKQLPSGVRSLLAAYGEDPDRAERQYQTWLGGLRGN
jgi:transcriptional regulator with XRE-family HTH domain